MLDIGWWELVVVAMIALIVVGPKDLPRILRVIGQWAGKARAMAREFQGSIDDMVREAGVDDIKKEVESVATFDVEKELGDAIDQTGAPEHSIEPPPPGGETEELPADDMVDDMADDMASSEPEPQADKPAEAGQAPKTQAAGESGTPAKTQAAGEAGTPAKTQAAGEAGTPAKTQAAG